jgi:hypothetical protein
MPLRPPAGFISAFYNPLQVPNAPTGVSASAGDTQATVSFTAPTNVGGGAITGYGAAAVKTSDGTTLTNTGASSPITVTGLTNDTAYTMNVWAINSFGPSPFGTSGSVTPEVPQLQRAVFAGGAPSGTANIMDYVTITSTGNAIDFGDLLAGRYSEAAIGGLTRGIFAGGSVNNSIEYITFATTGNATSFGELGGTTNNFRIAGLGNRTRGIVGGGTGAGSNIKYITIATTGNSTNFGDLSQNRDQLSGFSSPTRGCWTGGTTDGGSTKVNTIDYVTIASTGNATDFGDLTVARRFFNGCSSSVRGLSGGGQNASNAASAVIDYITIATTGNATNFGNLISAIISPASCSSNVRGLWAGGDLVNVISYVTIDTTGNSIDFGDLTASRENPAGATACNGGLQ